MKIYPWQTTQWQFLINTYQQKRLSHAYLLSGVAGLGKIHFAREFSTFLLCEDPCKKNTACGKCRSCHWMHVQSHPDFFAVFPHEKDHAIKIDDIRAVIQKTTQTSQRGGYQVVLIAPAEAMPIGSANALLKTLEEPSGDVVILLVSHDQHAIPATIMSRCQTIFFSGDHSDQTVQWLKENVSESSDINLLLSITHQAPLMVKTWSDQHYLSLRDEIIAHCDQLTHQAISAIQPIAIWLKYDIAVLLQILLTLFLDILRLQLKIAASFLTYSDCQEKIAALSQKISSQAIYQLIDLILEQKKMLSVGVSLNQQLLLENIFIQYQKNIYAN